MEHTPAPWFVADDGFIYAAGNECIADPHCDSQDIDEREANARLIAAAPDLLAALEFIVNDAEPGEDAHLTVDGYNRACAAIAKATR